MSRDRRRPTAQTRTLLEQMGRTLGDLNPRPAA